ncbi:MAG: PEP-CTERM sorting domain-containing protein [Acidobacteria bacterium]|nr:PEP-CTERM sorting domain-containing protein [Acidobacteriota bacterium]
MKVVIMIRTTLQGFLALGIWTTSAFAALIPIGSLPSSGNGIGAVNTLVTFQNTGVEVGCVGIAGTGTTATGTAQCFGGVTAPGGVTNEQTGSGNNTYTAAGLGFASTGANTLANLVLVFNGNEGGNAADKPITLSNLSLNLFSPAGILLGSFATISPFFATDFPGVGSAGYGFQLDAAQSAAANALLAANPGLVIGVSASASGANAGSETVFITRISTIQPGPGGDVPAPEPSSLWMIGAGLIVAGVAWRRRVA